MNPKTTTDLQEIRSWAEQRGGKPYRVTGSNESPEQGSTVLRIDFPGISTQGSLEEISWEEWYKIFNEEELEFLYQDNTTDGEESRFFKIISRQNQPHPN